ncbi:hypothetical protein BDW69DRAFT_179591 [Aspergillus filifer]
MKIPRYALEGLCVWRAAYENWAGRYNAHLERLKSVRYKEYTESEAEFVRTVESVRTRQSKSSGVNVAVGVEIYDLSGLRRLQEGVLAEMSVWEPYFDRLGLPSYEVLTAELFRGIIDCLVEGDVEGLMLEMKGSGKGFWYW